MTRKLISIILSAICVCSLCVPAFAAEVNESGYYIKDGKEYYDEDCVLARGDYGEYYMCTKTKRFFGAECEVCPYCNESHKQARYHYAQYYFENADRFVVSYRLVCPDCGNVISSHSDVSGLMDTYYLDPCSVWFYYNPETQRTTYNQFHCNKCQAYISPDDIELKITWSHFEDNVQYLPYTVSADKIATTHEAVATAEEWQQFKDEQAGRVKDDSLPNAPGYENNENYNPTIWERILNFFKKIYNAIASWF